MMRRGKPFGQATALTALVGLTAILLTGCMKVQADYVIKADDTFDAVMVIAYSEQALKDLAEASGQEIDELYDQMQFDSMVEALEEEYGSDATIEPYSEDGYTGSKISINNQDFSEMDRGSGTEELSIVREGDTYTLSGTYDASTLTEEMGGMGPLGDLGSLSDDMAPEIIFSFTFPGPVTSSTGQVDGNKVTFTMELGKVNVFDAQATADGSAPPEPTQSTEEPMPSGTTDPTTGSGNSKEDAGTKEASDNTGSTSVLSAPLLIALIAGGVVLLAAIVVAIVLVSKSSKKKALGPGGYAPPGVPPAVGQPYGTPPFAQPPAPYGQAPGTPQPYPPGAPTQPMPQADPYAQAPPTQPMAPPPYGQPPAPYGQAPGTPQPYPPGAPTQPMPQADPNGQAPPTQPMAPPPYGQ